MGQRGQGRAWCHTYTGGGAGTWQYKGGRDMAVRRAGDRYIRYMALHTWRQGTGSAQGGREMTIYTQEPGQYEGRQGQDT